MSACSWLVARSTLSARAFSASARAFSESARACRSSSSCLEMVTMSAGRGVSWGMLGPGKVCRDILQSVTVPAPDPCRSDEEKCQG